MKSNTHDTPDGNKNHHPLRFPLKISAVSWKEIVQAVIPLVLLCAVLVWAALHFVNSAPPRTITISAGPKGSTFEANAERYQKILARNGVTLKILESQGSIDNLHRMADPKSKVDIALVVSGLSVTEDTSNLESLGGSLFYQPLTIFYRSPNPIKRLSELQGHTIAIGAEGTATRFMALAMLKANGIEPGGSSRNCSPWRVRTRAIPCYTGRRRRSFSAAIHPRRPPSRSCCTRMGSDYSTSSRPAPMCAVFLTSTNWWFPPGPSTWGRICRPRTSTSWHRQSSWWYAPTCTRRSAIC